MYHKITIIFYMVVRQKKKMNSTLLPSSHFGMLFFKSHQGLATAWPTCPAYVDGKKCGYSFFRSNEHIIDASKWRHSVQFGC